jgi:hypothetical protein
VYDFNKFSNANLGTVFDWMLEKIGPIIAEALLSRS